MQCHCNVIGENGFELEDMLTQSVIPVSISREHRKGWSQRQFGREVLAKSQLSPRHGFALSGCLW